VVLVFAAISLCVFMLAAGDALVANRSRFTQRGPPGFGGCVRHAFCERPPEPTLRTKKKKSRGGPDGPKGVPRPSRGPRVLEGDTPGTAGRPEQQTSPEFFYSPGPRGDVRPDHYVQAGQKNGAPGVTRAEKGANSKGETSFFVRHGPAEYPKAIKGRAAWGKVPPGSEI